MMNLMHWRLMVAVADAKSVTRAAERYGITQSGASQAIAQMEESLGVKMFVRERRHTEVTAIGQQIVERARRMLDELTSIQQLADSAKDSHVGRIKLASFPSVFASMLPTFLQSFRRQHPRIEVITFDGTDEEVEQWLAADTVDVGVVMNPDPARDAVMIGRDSWVVVVPADHPLGRSTLSEVPLAALLDEPFVVATGGCHLHGESLAARAGLHLKNVKLRVHDWATAFALINEGIGISLVPASVLPVDKTGLRVLNLTQPIYRDFGLLCSSSGRQSAPVQALMAALKSAFQHDRNISIANA